MDTRSGSRRSAISRRAIVRYRTFIVLLFVIGVVLLAAYRLFNTSAAARTAEAHSQAARAEPHPRSLVDYLAIPTIVQPTPTAIAALDPAQQSAMNYVRLHQSVEPSPAYWNPLVQAVLDYLQAHKE